MALRYINPEAAVPKCIHVMNMKGCAKNIIIHFWSISVAYLSIRVYTVHSFIIAGAELRHRIGQSSLLIKMCMQPFKVLCVLYSQPQCSQRMLSSLLDWTLCSYLGLSCAFASAKDHQCTATGPDKKAESWNLLFSKVMLPVPDLYPGQHKRIHKH